ncbi:MAG: glycosyltransferase family 39 protein [Candidatus Obscuribacterales bacterium]|jgi:hypothetical protein|nr:glycosyltransferase family 39 protein [Candidatus Obscuribacterales bacterium]
MASKTASQNSYTNAALAGLEDSAAKKQTHNHRIWCAGQENIWFISILFCFICALLSLGSTNYPVNDDWIFGLPVQNFLETGQLQYCAAGPLAYPLIMLGIVTSYAIGFSYQNLHMVSSAFALTSAVGLYCALLELRVTRTLSALAVATFLFNPLTLNLSTHFMTETAAMSGICWYSWAMIRYFKFGSYRQLLIAGVVLSLTVATRQPLAVLVLANSSIFLKELRTDWRKAVALASLLIAAPVTTYFLADRMLTINSFCPQQFDRLKYLLEENLLSGIADPLNFFFKEWLILGQVTSYLALFLLPVIIGAVPFLITHIKEVVRNPNKGNTRDSAKKQNFGSVWQLAAIGLTSFALSILPLKYGIENLQSYFPYFRNLISPPLVGVYGLFPGFHLAENRFLSSLLSLIAEPCSFLLIAWLGMALIATKSNGYSDDTKTEEKITDWLSFSAGSLTAYVCLFMVVLRFDRYILPLLPILLLILVFDLSKRIRAELSSRPDSPDSTAQKQTGTDRTSALHTSKIAIKASIACSAVALLFLGTYSILALHDLFNFTRARWQALNFLLAQDISPRRIDGGPEFNIPNNIWLLNLMNQAEDACDYKARLKGEHAGSGYRWWPVPSTEFVVSQVPISGYEQIGRFPYFSDIKLSTSSILVLKKSQRSAPLLFSNSNKPEPSASNVEEQ